MVLDSFISLIGLKINESVIGENVGVVGDVKNGVKKLVFDMNE